MAKATGETVSERLIGGTLALIAAEGPIDLSVRRLAEASERSTMCVYTHFKGRANLLAAARAAASRRLLAGVDQAGSPLAGLRAFAAAEPQVMLWLLTSSETPALHELGAQLARDLLERLGAESAQPADELARVIGETVLDLLLADAPTRHDDASSVPAAGIRPSASNVPDRHTRS